MDNAIKTSSSIQENNQHETSSFRESIDVEKMLANLTLIRKFQSIVAEHITHPFQVKTPKEKIKKRPDGFDYVESSWMDKSFKEQSPLYSTELVHYSEQNNWITIIVCVTDRITGNSELGASSVRVQVRANAGPEPTSRDIIDKGNNVAAALSKAIKNAHSRFGHAADIYGKREEIKSESEIARYDSMLPTISSISVPSAVAFTKGWQEIGVDFTEYLDGWQHFIDSRLQQKQGVPIDKVKS